MKFHYNGKFNGDPQSLPTREHEEGYVPFKEPSQKTLAVVMNIIAFIITVALFVPVKVISRDYYLQTDNWYLALLPMAVGCMLVIFPHEFLHGLCFKGDVYMYTDLGKGLCFVVGPELMSKGRFILMCLLPNIVFGFVPYILWAIFPQLWYLGFWGALAIGMGGGDYMNVINALFQMPRGSKTYLHGMNSFWVMTDKDI